MLAAAPPRSISADVKQLADGLCDGQSQEFTGNVTYSVSRDLPWEFSFSWKQSPAFGKAGLMKHSRSIGTRARTW
jgi:hypothetical protein